MMHKEGTVFQESAIVDGEMKMNQHKVKEGEKAKCPTFTHPVNKLLSRGNLLLYVHLEYEDTRVHEERREKKHKKHKLVQEKYLHFQCLLISRCKCDC